MTLTIKNKKSRQSNQPSVVKIHAQTILRDAPFDRRKTSRTDADDCARWCVVENRNSAYVAPKALALRQFSAQKPPTGWSFETFVTHRFDDAPAAERPQTDCRVRRQNGNIGNFRRASFCRNPPETRPMVMIPSFSRVVAAVSEREGGGAERSDAKAFITLWKPCGGKASKRRPSSETQTDADVGGESTMNDSVFVQPAAIKP